MRGFSSLSSRGISVFQLDSGVTAIDVQNRSGDEAGGIGGFPGYRGEIAPGKKADLIRVRRLDDGTGVIRGVWRDGQQIA